MVCTWQAYTIIIIMTCHRLQWQQAVFILWKRPTRTRLILRLEDNIILSIIHKTYSITSNSKSIIAIIWIIMTIPSVV